MGHDDDGSDHALTTYLGVRGSRNDQMRYDHRHVVHGRKTSICFCYEIWNDYLLTRNDCSLKTNDFCFCYDSDYQHETYHRMDYVQLVNRICWNVLETLLEISPVSVLVRQQVI